MKALVLLSGGIDSTTCLAMAAEKHGRDEVVAISLNYGQKHVNEIQNAREVADWYGATHLNVALPEILFKSIHSGLTGDREIPDVSYSELEGVSPSFVPFRNGSLLSLATAFATANEIEEVWFGAHADDAAGWAYPDCTFEFLGAMANAIYVGTYHGVRLVAPLVWLTKKEVIRIGLNLDAPYHLTRSCYRGREAACGSCPTCRDRRAAFESNGVEDPIVYETVNA